MSQISPIEDSYIDGIIISSGAYNPDLNATQGVQLRALIKLLRDWGDQQVATVSDQTVPAGGTTGQVLAKVNDTDYDTAWQDSSSPVAATTTTAGIAALATIAEALAGTDNANIMTALTTLGVILDQRKNVQYGINPVSLTEVSILMENAGNVLSSLTANLTNLKLKIGYAGSYPAGTQTYPFAYNAGDTVLITYSFSDPNNLRGNLKLTCRDN